MEGSCRVLGCSPLWFQVGVTPKCCRRLTGKDVSVLGLPSVRSISPSLHPAHCTGCWARGLQQRLSSSSWAPLHFCTAPGRDLQVRHCFALHWEDFTRLWVALCSPSCLSKHLFFLDPPPPSQQSGGFAANFCFIFKCLLQGY